MRPQGLMEFVAETLGKAPEVQRAEVWQEGTIRPFGVQVTFVTGSEMWLGVMAQAAPGESYDQPEKSVTDAPPAEVAVPELLQGGKVTPASAEAYIAAVLNNSGCPEIKRTYAYSEGATPTRPTAHPGVGIEFHSKGRGFLPFIHTARPGQGKGNRAFDLQDAF
ncbi:hypothetical protein ACFYXD_35145 [Streptomyces platensis]|uniref:hypothetical protein n=1 Tax=Streptomyces platensis TaxID=58346 RepID=UPI00367872BF